MNTIPIIKLSKQRLDQYAQFLDRQVIKVPSDDLLEIYERRVLTELSYLRAEKFDSPEHYRELRTLEHVPRNIQNPNFDRLMGYYDRLNSNQHVEQTLQILVEIAEFLICELEVLEPFEYSPQIYEPQIDVRCCETLEQYFNYILTKGYLKNKS